MGVEDQTKTEGKSLTGESVSSEQRYSRDIMPDELPGINDINSDFEYLLTGFNNGKHRVGLALEYAGYLKDRYVPGEYSCHQPEYIQDQILPRLYLDSLVVSASRDGYYSISKHLGSRETDARVASLHGLIGAKLDLQRDIGDYAKINNTVEGTALFGNLALIMHHSRRLLFGDDVTSEKVRQQNLDYLTSILAEYKVLSALHEEWPYATLGTVEEDTQGTDIVIPSSVKPCRGVILQVKSSRDTNCKLAIFRQNKTTSVVRVPMNVTQHNPLSLSREHRDLLINFVRTAPRSNIALTQEPLQTEVDKVELAA